MRSVVAELPHSLRGSPRRTRLHSLTRLLRGASVHQLVTYRQLVQHLHLRRAARRNRLNRALARSQQPVRTLAPPRMTERQSLSQSGMGPPGLAPTLARIGRSIRASTLTLASMAPSIEPAGDAPFGERRGSAPQRSLLRDLRLQRHVAWHDPHHSPLGPPRWFSSRCWSAAPFACSRLRPSVRFSPTSP